MRTSGERRADGAEKRDPKGRTVRALWTIVWSCLTLPALSAHAAMIYVDRDHPCPGTGSSASPYCTIQRAFEHPPLGPGDVIRIRESATPYDERATLGVSGLEGNPVIIEPDAGHAPVIRYTGNGARAGAIEITNQSHITVRNLTFDGTGVQTSDEAIRVIANNTDVTGITISKNTFRNWGGTGLNTQGASPVEASGTEIGDHRVAVVISDNLFEESAFEAIRVSYSFDSLIERNMIRGNRCGLYPDGRRGSAGVKIADDGRGDIIRDNIVEQFNADCTGVPAGSGGSFRGLYCDTGPKFGTFERNIVRDIPSGAEDVIAIEVESRCEDWVVKNNLIHDIGSGGQAINLSGAGPPHRTQIINNTIANVAGEGVLVRDATRDTVIQNNIFHHMGTRAIRFRSEAVGAGGHAIDYNLYWDDAGGSKVGAWGGSSTDNFSRWQADCDCDHHSINADPNFVSSREFQLQPASPAIDTGVAIVSVMNDLLQITRPQGAAYDMGAYELTTSISPGSLGDLDQDRDIDLSDLRLLIHMLIGQVPQDLDAGDLDEDGVLGVGDVRALIQILVRG